MVTKMADTELYDTLGVSKHSSDVEIKRVRSVTRQHCRYIDTYIYTWAEKREPGTHCLHMLSSPRIFLEISVKSAPVIH